MDLHTGCLGPGQQLGQNFAEWGKAQMPGEAQQEQELHTRTTPSWLSCRKVGQGGLLWRWPVGPLKPQKRRCKLDHGLSASWPLQGRGLVLVAEDAAQRRMGQAVKGLSGARVVMTGEAVEGPQKGKSAAEGTEA